MPGSRSCRHLRGMLDGDAWAELDGRRATLSGESRETVRAKPPPTRCFCEWVSLSQTWVGLSALGRRVHSKPRALPWAGMRHDLGAVPERGAVPKCM
jgi:hypothetical protein